MKKGNSWRPIDWDEIEDRVFDSITLDDPYYSNEVAEGIRKGADAMLASVIRQPVILGQLVRNMINTDVKWYDSVTAMKDGGWYFIPDQKPPDGCNSEETE